MSECKENKVQSHCFSLKPDGLIMMWGIPVYQNKAVEFLESGRIQMENQEKEIAELKQRWEDFTTYVDNEVTFYIDMAMKNKKHVDSVEVLGNIWTKMEELSEEKA